MSSLCDNLKSRNLSSKSSLSAEKVLSHVVPWVWFLSIVLWTREMLSPPPPPPTHAPIQWWDRDWVRVTSLLHSSFKPSLLPLEFCSQTSTMCFRFHYRHIILPATKFILVIFVTLKNQTNLNVMWNHNHFIVLINSMGQGFGKGTTGMALLHSTMSGPLLVRRAGGSISKMVSLLTSQVFDLGWLKGWLNWHCWLDYLIRASSCGLGPL